MKKWIYWLSSLSAIILIQIAGIANLSYFRANYFNIVRAIEPLLFYFLIIIFITLTAISFKKIIKEEPRKTALLHYFLFILSAIVGIVFSLVVSHNFLLYPDSGCDFLCGIELFIFPIAYLIIGGILNLIILLTNKTS